MFAAADSDFAGAGYRVDATLWQVSPRLVALASALTRLLGASDAVADALTRHDRTALDRSNEVSTALMAEIGHIAGDLSDDDRLVLAESPIPSLRERLAVASRRNAYLIEQAWAVDAALMRLILGGGRIGAENSSVTGYETAPGPAYVDRGA